MALRKYRVGYKGMGDTYYIVGWKNKWEYTSTAVPEEAQRFKTPIECVKIIETFPKDTQQILFFEPCT